MKTLVITLPRSASENFCKLYAQQHDLAYVNEVWNVQQSPKYPNINGHEFLQHQIDFWAQCQNSVGKLFAYDVIGLLNCDEQTSLDYFKRIAEHADNVIYLYRRDTTKQVISTVVAKRTDIWGKTRRYTLEGAEIKSINFEQCAVQLLKSHKLLLEIRKHIPGQTVCAEDYLQGSEYQKYPNQYTDLNNYQYNLENIEQLYEQS